MKVTIQIEDEVGELYESRLRPKQTLEKILAVQLKRFQHVDPRDRVLILGPETRRRIEEVTTRLPLQSTDDLVKRISELAELSIGQIRFRFTPPQWRELKHRADRWRMPVAKYAERVVRQIEAQFFNEVPRELPQMMPAAPAGDEKQPDASA